MPTLILSWQKLPFLNLNCRQQKGVPIPAASSKLETFDSSSSNKKLVDHHGRYPVLDPEEAENGDSTGGFFPELDAESLVENIAADGLFNSSPPHNNPKATDHIDMGGTKEASFENQIKMVSRTGCVISSFSNNARY